MQEAARNLAKISGLASKDFRNRMVRATLLALLGVGIGAALLFHRAWPWEKLTFVGMVLVSVSAVVLVRYHLRHTEHPVLEPHILERIVWLNAGLAILGIQLQNYLLGTAELQGSGFLMAGPIVAMTMLVSALAGPSVAVFTQTVVVFLLSLSRATPIDMVGASWLAGAVAAHAVNPLKRRSDLLRAATVQSLAMALLGACISAISTDDARLVLESAGWAALAGIGATSIFWLLVAAEERLFGIVSDWTLLELCSPDHPLIRELCLRAPGTYAHSVMVGQLAESAAREIGANPILCRAMAYFHDVGKIQRPSFFVENQIGENPHDTLSPILSANIIAAHVRDGLELAREHGLPQILRDAIAEHHGTTLIAYFYDRARTQAGGEEAILEQFFRYEGPKPQTKETAILMLADTVEAASRTIPRRNTEQLEATVWRLVEDRRADGQLDECDLTLSELQVIQRAFVHAMGALRHDRVAYPEQEGHDPSIETAHLRVQRVAKTNTDSGA